MGDVYLGRSSRRVQCHEKPDAISRAIASSSAARYGGGARVLAERGVFDEGGAHGHEAIRIAEALDRPFSVLVGCLDLAYLKSIRGELSQAVGLLERVVAQCGDWDITSREISSPAVAPRPPRLRSSLGVI